MLSAMASSVLEREQPVSRRDSESGYGSDTSSVYLNRDETIPPFVLTKAHLSFLNSQLQHLEPQGKLQLLRLQHSAEKLT